jgi:F0F1-type ATP synthase assembly protein I
MKSRGGVSGTDSSDRRYGAALALGTAVVALACCAVPLLIAGGVFASLGAFRGQLAYVLAGVVLVATAFIYVRQARHAKKAAEGQDQSSEESLRSPPCC